MFMNVYAFQPFIAGLLNLSLILWVYLRAPAGLLRRIFILWNIEFAIWNFSMAVGYTLPNMQTVCTWYQWTIPVSIAWIAPCFFHFVVIVTESSNRIIRRTLPLAYASGFIFAVFGTGTRFMIRQIVPFSWGFYPIGGPGVIPHGLIWFSLVGYSFYLMIKSLGSVHGHRRNQVKYLLVASIIYFTGSITNFMPLFGISIYPMGNISNSIYSLIVAYAIVEYGLMDMRTVFRRSAVYGVLAGGLTGVYLSLVMVLKYVLGHHGVGESYLFYTAAVPVTVVMAPTMKARIEMFIERAPFWKTYEYSRIFREFGLSVLTILDLPTAARRVIDQMMHILDTGTGAIYLIQPAERHYVRIVSEGAIGPERLETDNPIVLYFLSGKNALVKEEVLWHAGPRESHGEGSELVTRLKEWPYAMALPLFIQERLIGCIALGEKASGDMFSTDDVELLKALTSQAAVALSNAGDISALQAQRQSLQKGNDMVLAGILATEIAHELTMPLTHILNEQTRLEKSISGVDRESLQKIQNEALRASEILDGFSMLSPQSVLRKTQVRLPVLLDNALSNLGIPDDPSIRIQKSYTDISNVWANAGQLLQVFSNVLQNAWHAMREGGTLTLLIRSAGEGSGGPSVARVEIEDTGPGIPEPVQEKIFEPFFTTKAASGGRGLGLTISKAMMKRHGGSITLKSPIHAKGGTRVILELPLGLQGETHV